MKKKILAVVCCVAMIAAMAMGCTTKSPTSGGDKKDDGGEGGKKIGITIQNYENAYWAGVMSKLEEILKNEGYDATIVGCEENSAKQIEQIENFITYSISEKNTRVSLR